MRLRSTIYKELGEYCEHEYQEVFMEYIKKTQKSLSQTKIIRTKTNQPGQKAVYANRHVRFNLRSVS